MFCGHSVLGGEKLRLLLSLLHRLYIFTVIHKQYCSPVATTVDHMTQKKLLTKYLQERILGTVFVWLNLVCKCNWLFQKDIKYIS